MPPPTDRPHAENNFNLLRLLLASAVVFSHSYELIDRNRFREPLASFFHTYTAGDLAVDGFFMLSGFLILQSWRRDPHVGRYLARRILRIYPLFIVATLICGLALGPLFGGGAHYFAQFQPLPFLKWMLLLREPFVPPVFVGSPYYDVNGPMWTIQYEFMCYLLVAVAGAVGLNRGPRFWWLLWLAAMTLNLLYVDAINEVRFPGSRYLLGDEPGSFVRFLTFFSVGALVCHYRQALRWRARWAGLALLVCFAAEFSFSAAKLVLPTAGAYLLFWSATVRLAGLEAVQRFVRRNDLSYGVYLFGWPVQQIVLHYTHTQSPTRLTLLALPLALGCAFASWKLLERHALRLKPGGSSVG